MTIREQIEFFQPWNAQETVDRDFFLRCIDRESGIYTRENPSMHITSSCWIVSPDRALALMAYHNLYQSWAWLGGHLDGDSDPLQAALREAREESGLTRIRPVLEDLFSLEILSVPGHEKKGTYISSHLHLNLTYLLEADPSEPLHHKSDENSRVDWFPPEKAIALSTEPWFQNRIYPKLVEKTRNQK